MKEGYWKAKGCQIDYILRKDDERERLYKAYCLQTKQYRTIEEDRCRHFLENHTFVCTIEEVFDKVSRN